MLLAESKIIRVVFDAPTLKFSRQGFLLYAFNFKRSSKLFHNKLSAAHHVVVGIYFKVVSTLGVF